MTHDSSIRWDRAAGVLLGQACGDALGVPYEFARPPAAGKLAEMRGGGLGPYAPGEWSDDTQMAICVGRVAASGADLTSADALDEIADGFLGWLDDGASDVGNQTRAVLSRAGGRPGSPFERLRAAAQDYTATHAQSAGNGALIRTSIIGLTAWDDRDQTAAAARAVAALTHADPLALDSCVLWSEAVRVAATGGDLDVRSGLDLVPAERRGPWQSWITEAETQPASSFGHNGFTVTALQAAWTAIVQTPVPEEDPEQGTFACHHFQHALHAAVRVGGDTDTVAAIAGGLLGARWGVSAVPAAWRQVVHGWPGMRARDLVELAVVTAQDGGTVGRWPITGHMSYAENRKAQPPARHPYDSKVLLGTTWPTPTEADVVVSLCRVGSGQRHLPLVEPRDHLEVWLIDDDDALENPHLDHVLRDTASFIATQSDQGRRVYVHSVAAQQRTPSVALAYARWRGHDPVGAAAQVRGTFPAARGKGRLWEHAARVRPEGEALS